MKTIKYLKCIGVVLLLQLISIAIYANTFDSDLKNATNAYNEENYSLAISLYKEILQKHGDSQALYYNLGNAYFKTNKIAESILNYERALLIDPSDEDTRFNLNVAKQKTVDQIDPISIFFVNRYFQNIQTYFSVNTWAKLGITSFIIFIICLILFFFGRRIRLKKIGFYVAIIAVIFTVISNLFAFNQLEEQTTRDTAIVFTPTIPIKSSPDKSGTDLFVLHEGCKVKVISKLGDWSEIEIADGNKGWIETKNIRTI
jgi:tetratricopeptide (TPR) repeat protein